MIDQATIDRILNAAQIVDVVSEYVTLRRAGVNYKGLCPFHNEKTPSFVVSPAKGLCKCFSCGKGGNVVHFIMEHEQLSYYDALRFLAKKYHIEIHERELTDEEKQAQSLRESLFIVNHHAAEFFQNTLHDTPEGVAVGMEYFRQRGFRDDIIRKFQLGYSPAARGAFAKEALQKGYKKEYLVKTGLCYEGNDGQLHDRFWGRVIFPVHTLSGKVVAFGGRVLKTDAKAAKYVNSPESEIYHKSNELYGIYLAKQAIMKQDCCFLVEGYTDVISMHQSGIENVVASSGTSLTTGQIQLIHRFTNNITVLYDGDSAGIKASLRGIDMLLKEGMNIKVVLLPDGDDPDSFARKHNSEEYQAYIKEHQIDFIRFKTNLLLQEADNDPIRKAALISDIVQSISVIPEAIKRSVYTKECSQLMQINENILVDEINKLKKKQAEKENHKANAGEAPGEQAAPAEEPRPAATAPPAEELNAQEKLIMQLIIRHGEKVICQLADDQGNETPITVAEYIANDLSRNEMAFHSPQHQTILDEVCQHIHESNFHAKRYFLSHPSPEISKLAADLSSDPYQLSKLYLKDQPDTPDEEQLYEETVHLMIDFKSFLIKDKLKHTLQMLQDPLLQKDERRFMEVMKQYKELNSLQSELAKHQGDRVILP